ncbi:hypothetical protein [Clostridium tertium]|uniref:hypothetical protein n=1 Tax=Clostridium tertium TaxID=1559 RepID=UPI0020292A4D|nr:hypothetical protein [Clostridium tertium]
MIDKERIIISLLIFAIALICLAISKRPALTKKEEQELQELDNEISRLYGVKK